MAGERWSVSREVTIRWDESVGLVAEGSLSREPLPLPPDAVGLLDAVRAHPVLDDAIAAFLDRYAADGDAVFERQVRGLVGTLQGAGIIVPTDAGERRLQDGGAHYSFASPHAHVQMLRDRVRIDAYRRAIERQVGGRTVLDLGSGTGILAMFAARAGAKHVYAIEETSILDIAKQLAEANGLAGSITFLGGNSRDILLPDKVDVVVSELIGNEPLGERIIPVLRDAARRFLREDGTMIPARLSVGALGVQSRTLEVELAQSVESIRSAGDLGEQLGFDMSPLVEAYRDEFSRGRVDMTFSQHLRPPGEENGAVVLTAEQLVGVWDLARLEGVGSRLQRPLAFDVIEDGLHNAMVTFFTAHLDDHVVLTTSPFAAEQPTSWGGQLFSALAPLPVRKGEKLKVTACVDATRTRGGIRYERDKT